MGEPLPAGIPQCWKNANFYSLLVKVLNNTDFTERNHKALGHLNGDLFFCSFLFLRPRTQLLFLFLETESRVVQMDLRLTMWLRLVLNSPPDSALKYICGRSEDVSVSIQAYYKVCMC